MEMGSGFMCECLIMKLLLIHDDFVVVLSAMCYFMIFTCCFDVSLYFILC